MTNERRSARFILSLQYFVLNWRYSFAYNAATPYLSFTYFVHFVYMGANSTYRPKVNSFLTCFRLLQFDFSGISWLEKTSTVTSLGAYHSGKGGLFSVSQTQDVQETLFVFSLPFQSWFSIKCHTNFNRGSKFLVFGQFYSSTRRFCFVHSLFLFNSGKCFCRLLQRKIKPG